jgi:hypothetical protein
MKEAPLSAVLQEKVKNLELERDEFKRQLGDCRQLYQVLKDENHELAKRLAEDILFHKGTEFRKGRTTANQWMPFCPVCKLPVKVVEGFEHMGLVCCNAPKCSWHSAFSAYELAVVLGEVAALEKTR